MQKENLEKQYALKILVNYGDRRSKNGIVKAMFQIALMCLLMMFFSITVRMYAHEALDIHYYTLILMAFVVIFIVSMCGYLYFLIKVRSKEGCSGLCVFWEPLFAYIGCVIGGFYILHVNKEIFNIKYDMQIAVIILSFSIVISAAIRFIVDKNTLRKGKVPTQVDDSKAPCGAVIFAIVMLFTNYTPASIAEVAYFTGAEIVGVMGGAGLAREIYRLYLIKKNNLKAEFGYITKNTPGSENNKAE